MPSVSKVLECIIHKNSHFCCLCFDTSCDELIRLEDEVAIDINGSVENLMISEILILILRDEIYDYVKTFQTLCDKCTKTAINSYIFIKTSKLNSDHMVKVLQCFTSSIEYAADDIKDSKSLYLSLNLNDFTSKQFYDCKHAHKNPKSVLRRYKTIDNQRKIEIMSKSVNSNKDNKREYLMINNILLCDKNNPDLIKCRVCLKVYPTLVSLQNHYKKVHALKSYECTKCRRKFYSKGFLNAHLKSYHCNVACTECGKTFNNKHSLNLHEITHYMMIICADCGRTYKSKTSYKKHKELNVCGQKTRANPVNAKYTCDYCNKKYTQKVSLRVHIQYEHGNYKAHICEWCGKKFWAQSRLKAHIVKHTRERKFKCNLCDKKFVTKESLLYHTRLHTGEKPYECSECNCKFLSMSRRNDHMKRYHVGATIECDICFSKFNTNTLLQKHKKTHVDCKEVNVKYIIDETKANVPKFNDSEVNNISIQRGCNSADEINYGNAVYNEVGHPQSTKEIYDENAKSDSAKKIYLEVCDRDDEYVITFKK